VAIDKFHHNIILVNINKLKPVEDHTFQPVLAKPNVFILEKLVETIYSSNLLFDELVETNHYGNMFVEELVKFHTRSLIAINLIEKKTNCSLSN
jgi:hypothetical protein